MTFTRRTILRQGAACLGVAALPRLGWAASSITLGAARIDTLSDGHLVLPRDFILGGLPEAELAGISARYGLDGPQLLSPCNVTLYRDGERVVLFDVGAGPDFMPTAGKMHAALDTLGLSNDDVTHVVFTHAHPDHLWGLLDEFDEPIFANAEYRIGKAEWEYWLDPATVDTIGQERTTFAVGAARRLAALEDSIITFSDGEEILPGIAARGSFGHTPGHMSFEIRQGSDSVMVVGDAIGNGHVGFERPQWAVNSDQDPEMGAQTRAGLLDQIAAEKIRLIGFHMPEGGIGRAEKTADGYRFVPGEA